MSTTDTPLLSTNAVLEHLDKLATRTIEVVLPRERIAGGWADAYSEGKDQPSKSHYLRIIGPSDEEPGAAHLVSLCGQIEAHGDPAELIDCDPLAPENCTACRRVLLAANNYI